MASHLAGLLVHLQQIAPLLLHHWIELLVPRTEEGVGHIQPLAIQPAEQTQCIPCYSPSIVCDHQPLFKYEAGNISAVALIRTT